MMDVNAKLLLFKIILVTIASYIYEVTMNTIFEFGPIYFIQKL